MSVSLPFLYFVFQLIPAKTPSAPKLILQQGHAGVCVMQVGHSPNPHYSCVLARLQFEVLLLRLRLLGVYYPELGGQETSAFL